MMPPTPTCTEGDTKCEVRTSTLYECVGGVWVLIHTYPCPGCVGKECEGDPVPGPSGEIIYPSVCC